MKKATLFAVIAFSILSLDGLYYLCHSIYINSKYGMTGFDDIFYILLGFLNVIAFVLLDIFFIKLYRKQK